MIDFKLPSLGADMDEGKLLQWNVVPGQTVKKGDIVAVVDTSKAAVDVEIWCDGVVHELIASVGETIPVGTVVARLLAPGEAAPAATQKRAPKAAHKPLATAPVPAAVAAPPAAAPAAAPAMRQRVLPAARKLAAELGVDLAALSGSGADGAVARDDVERAAQAAAQPAPSAAQLTAADKQAQMRRAIAAAMSRSKREIPHYYLAESVPMRSALDWLAKANAERPVTERLLPAVLLIKAVALAVRNYPEMNGFFCDGEFRPGAAAHVGVAIALRQGGLIAPALHDAGDKPLPVLMRELADLVQRCRAGSLRSSEMSDPTITVTNLGDQGVDSVHGVIYPPQVALVGFGRVASRPVVEGERVVAMSTVVASLAADHRVSDGHRGALFLAKLRALLQQPGNL